MNDPTNILERETPLPSSLRCLVAARPAVLQSLEDAPDEALSGMIDLHPVDLAAPIAANALAASRCLFLEVDPEVPQSVARMEDLRRDRPDLVIVAIVDQPGLQLVRSLMRSGVRDVIGTPLRATEVASILFDVAAGMRPEKSRLSPAVALASPTGGAGATTLVTHLAAAWTRNNPGKTCCVVDLDVQYGDIANYYGLTPKSSVIDLLEAGDRLDSVMVRDSATATGRGPVVLAAPAELNPLEVITIASLQRLLRLCRTEYDLVLLDLPSSWANWVLSTIVECNLVLLLTEPSLHSIRRTRRCLDLLDEVGLPADHTALVVNNVQRKFLRQIDVSDVEETLQRLILGTVPRDSETLSKAQDQGLLLDEVARKTAFSTAVDTLAIGLQEKIAVLSA
jgi:pilus assembly protein CpaE